MNSFQDEPADPQDSTADAAETQDDPRAENAANDAPASELDSSDLAGSEAPAEEAPAEEADEEKE